MKTRRSMCGGRWFSTIARVSIVSLLLTQISLGDPPETATITIDTKNHTVVNYRLETGVQWLTALTTPAISIGDPLYDELLLELAGADSDPDAYNLLQGVFYVTGNADFDSSTPVSLAGFELGNPIDLNTSSTSLSVRITALRPDGTPAVRGVDYFAGDSEDPADWVAVYDVFVFVDNDIFITHQFWRQLSVFVTPAATDGDNIFEIYWFDQILDSPPVVPEPASIVLLIVGALLLGRYIQRRNAARTQQARAITP